MERTKLKLIFGILGVAVAAAAGLADHVHWLAALCGGLFSNCSEAGQFALFGVPLWAWGIGYYLILIGLIFIRGQLVSAWVAVGFGVELTLAWIMITARINCVFCLANLLIIVLILMSSFERSRFWQTLAVTSLICILSALLIPSQNELSASQFESWDQMVVARVKAREITAGELILPIVSELQELENKIYQKKKERLERMIAEVLFQDEASRRGITVQELVNELLPQEDFEVSNAEVERYYLENQSRWQNWAGSIDQLKKRAENLLVQERFVRKMVEKSRTLPGGDDVAIFLKEPEPPTIQVSIGSDPTWGPSNAPVTVIEFSDYECPMCRKTHETIKTVRETYKGQIRWVFKDFPLKMHRWAKKAAEAARCADDQGKFWEYQDLLYAGNRELQVDQLKTHAKEIGLNAEQFDACLEGGKFQAQIDNGVEVARRTGIHATPTFVINGKYHPGAPTAENFKALIDTELKKTPQQHR